MSRSGRALRWLAMIGLAWVLAGCQAPAGGAGDTPRRSGDELRVGFDSDYPPLAFIEGGQARGLEADMANEIGRRLGRAVRFVPLETDALIPALEGQEIDVIMSGMTINKVREQRVQFTQPYMRMGQMAIIRASTRDVSRYGRPQSLYLPDLSVGVEAGAGGDEFARQYLPNARVMPFPNAAAGLDALRAGRIDVFIHDAPTSWTLEKEGTGQLISLYRPLTEEFVAWAVRKDDNSLRQQLDSALGEMSRDGTMLHLQSRWIPLRVEIN